MKHGLGEVRITLEGDDGTARLVVEDDGAGFAADFDPVMAANTGLELVMQLAHHDLRGTITFENRQERGARVVVTFPLARG